MFFLLNAIGYPPRSKLREKRAKKEEEKDGCPILILVTEVTHLRRRTQLGQFVFDRDFSVLRKAREQKAKALCTSNQFEDRVDRTAEDEHLREVIGESNSRVIHISASFSSERKTTSFPRKRPFVRWPRWTLYYMSQRGGGRLIDTYKPGGVTRSSTRLIGRFFCVYQRARFKYRQLNKQRARNIEFGNLLKHFHTARLFDHTNVKPTYHMYMYNVSLEIGVIF